MKKTIILMVLLLIPIVLAIDECKGTIEEDDVPCIVLLPINTTTNPCSGVSISYYANASRFIYTQGMSEYNPFNCNSTFNQTDLGTYTFSYSTGDSGTITVKEDVDNRFWLFIVAFLIVFIFIIIGHYLEDPTFIIISGFLLCVIALNIFTGGFPGLKNEFLKNTVVIVIAGIGFYLIIAPSMKFLEDFKGSFGGRFDD